MKEERRIMKNEVPFLDNYCLFIDAMAATPVENILFTLLCTLHQPNSIDQCLFLAVVNFILAATQVRYF